MAEVLVDEVLESRITELPVLIGPALTDVLHAVDLGENPLGIDKQLAIGEVVALAREGLATEAQGALADTALQPGDVDLGYTPATRTITNTAGQGVALPLVATGAAGLAPASGGGTSAFLRADGTWAAPPAGNPGTVTSVGGGAGLTGTVTSSGSLAVGAGTGITVNADDVAINRTVVDGWYASAAEGDLAGTALQPGDAATPAQGAKADTALQPGDVDLGYTPATRTITNTGGNPAVLPLMATAAAGLAPASGGGTANFLRADGTWAPPPGGGATNLDGLSDVALSGPAERDFLVFAGPIWENLPASSLLFNSAEDGFAPASGGGTTNFLRADGTWAAPPAGGGGATNLDGLSDVTLTSPSNGQILKFDGTGWINAAPPTGGGGTVTQVDGGAGLTGSVTTTGSLAVGAGTGITVAADAVSINRAVTDGWYATAAQGALAGTALQPGQAATPANGTLATTALQPGEAATPAQGAKADTALQPGSVDLGFTPATRTITNTGGDGVVLPLVATGAAGLAPQSGGGTTNFLRADGTWAAPPAGDPLAVVSDVTDIPNGRRIVNYVELSQADYDALPATDPDTVYLVDGDPLGGGGGTVTQVDGGAGLTGSVTTTGSLAVGAGTGITVNTDSVSINRAVVDGWYASASQGALALSALQFGDVDLGYTAATRTITNSAGDSVVLPLVASGAAGLAPASGGGTANFLRADGTWAAPPAGNPGTVTSVSGGAGLTGTVTASGSLAVGAGTGITVNADDVAINRTVTDTWYATAAQGALAGTALQPGSVDLGFDAATRTITNTGGDAVVLPLVVSGAAGLAPASGGGTTNFLRADGTWAPAGGGQAPGVGAASYRWLSAALTDDPGNGNIGADTASWLNATELYFSSLDVAGTNISAWMGARKVGDRVRVQDAINAGAYALYIVTAPLINSGAFWLIPVRLIENASTEPVNNRPVTVAFTAAVVGSDPTAVTGALSVSNMISLTQAQYDAIVTKNPVTLYVIT